MAGFDRPALPKLLNQPIMRKSILIFAALMAFTALSAQDYTLVWSDEFNDPALNTDIWNIEVNNSGCGNAELEYYSERGVSMGVEPNSGEHCLILTARKEEWGSGSGLRHFTSGRINSSQKVYFTHGIVEAQILIPSTANGLWPAFWMMGNDHKTNGWPRCGEIDIMEMGNANGIKNGTQDRYFNGAAHWGFYKHNAYPNYGVPSTNSYSLQDGQFHLFTLVWDESNLTMYLDRDKYPNVQPYYKMGIESTDGDWATGNYFHKPFFILFNLAVGGNFPNIKTVEGITALANEERSMYVNYVRVYQKEKNIVAPASTGLDDAPFPAVEATKLIINGRLLILRDGTYYNAQGQILK